MMVKVNCSTRPAATFLFGGLYVFLYLYLFGAAASDVSTLGATLNSRYLGKVFTLRGFYSDKRLHFDNKGKVVGQVHLGSWTTSMIAIEGVKVFPGKIELKGLRWAEFYDTRQKKFVALPTKEKILMEIDRDPAEPDAAALAVGSLFMGNNDRLQDLVPRFWTAIVSGALETVRQKDGTDCHYIKGVITRDEMGNLSAPCEEDGKMNSSLARMAANVDVSGIPYTDTAKDIVPPQPILDPPPAYTEIAKSLEVQGKVLVKLVVGTDGSPKDVEILEPLGAGLDDQAAEAVTRWKFKPAMLKGYRGARTGNSRG